MGKLNLNFDDGNVLTAEEMNQIVGSINELYNQANPLSLSVTGGGVFKKGSSQTITVRWTVKEGDSIVTPDSVSVNKQPVTNTETSKEFANVTTDTTYTVDIVKDSISKSATTTAAFVNPSYIGVVAKTFEANETNIKALTENIKAAKTYTATGLNLNDQKVCYAYPKTFGALSSIKDGNGFENINSYTRSEVTVNGELYYVYVLTTETTISNLKQIYA